MKTVLLIVLLGFFGMLSIKAGADSAAYAPDENEYFESVENTSVNNCSGYIEPNSEKEHIFAAVPDTTIEIIIIYRRVSANTNEITSKNL
jgi:hypothetical protein